MAVTAQDRGREDRRPLRVAVWSTGGIGAISIRTIVARPDLELVGVWVHNAEKVGRDVGDLVGVAPIGLRATNDADALLALRPDCIVYAASGPEMDAAAVPDYVRMLRAGINVVTTTSTTLVYPPAFLPVWRDELAQAAQAGRASLYASGIFPGFAAEYLPVVLATQSSSIRSIRATEISLYDDYPVASMMMDGMGFGRALDFQPMVAMPGALTYVWGGPIRLIADALGAEIEEFREQCDRVPTPRTLEVACGTLPAGTCGAVRMQIAGVIGGYETIVIDHVVRMAPDLALEWPRTDRGIGYYVSIKGEPDIENRMEVSYPSRPGAGAGAMVATAMRVVNAIPYVVRAAPGLLSPLDLPITAPKHAFFSNESGNCKISRSTS